MPKLPPTSRAITRTFSFGTPSIADRAVVPAAPAGLAEPSRGGLERAPLVINKILIDILAVKNIMRTRKREFVRRGQPWSPTMIFGSREPTFEEPAGGGWRLSPLC